ncbi:MAG: hypothetical protein GPJ54_15670 [Candidatus Heimdallarchaeota archaeon]|nr:hypothetical protein [Candidatus Heimdallarchaeota archaeon]
MVESTCENSKINRNNLKKFDYKNDLDYHYYEDYRVIFHYKYYIIRTFGLEAWNKLLGMYKFNEAYYISIQTFGEVILQTLIDYTALILDVTISDLLEYFIAYRRKAENLLFDDFTYFD